MTEITTSYTTPYGATCLKSCLSFHDNYIDFFLFFFTVIALWLWLLGITTGQHSECFHTIDRSLPPYSSGNGGNDASSPIGIAGSSELALIGGGGGGVSGAPNLSGASTPI